MDRGRDLGHILYPWEAQSLINSGLCMAKEDAMAVKTSAEFGHRMPIDGTLG